MTGMRLTRSTLMTAFVLIVPPGCESMTDPPQPNPATASEDLMVAAGVTVDAEGNTVVPIAADPATLLYYRRTGEPVLAPDGHHVTAGEFRTPQGTAQATCGADGTEVALSLEGLIPNAVYRIWILNFKAPGFDLGPPPDFANVIGEGALGANDRSENTFVAAADGGGQLTRIHPAGPMSETLPSPPYANEPAGPCLLTDEFEWHVVGAFQQPGYAYGPDVGPPLLFPGTAVEQFIFLFAQQ